jgi:mono/diheme cytochrome c family protein
MRLMLAALVVLVMGCAIAGIGMGQAPAERAPAPSASAIRAAERRIAAAGAQVARGRTLFAAQGCDRCHSSAAVGADGRLGPRLDTLDEDAEHIAEGITEPREDTADGFPEKLMPTDYAQRMSDAEISALAAFIVTAAGGEHGDSSGRGRGRGRGGRGSGGED